MKRYYRGAVFHEGDCVRLAKVAAWYVSSDRTGVVTKVLKGGGELEVTMNADQKPIRFHSSLWHDAKIPDPYLQLIAI